MVSHKMAYIFTQIGVPHSWKDYIYSLSTLYNVSKPFAIFELISVFPATLFRALGFLSQLIRFILFLGNLFQLIPILRDFIVANYFASRQCYLPTPRDASGPDERATTLHPFLSFNSFELQTSNIMFLFGGGIIGS